MLFRSKGRKSQSTPRKVAIFLCQYLGDHRLKAIKDYFGLGHIGSVSYITSKMRAELALYDKLKGEIESVVSYIINDAT